MCRRLISLSVPGLPILSGIALVIALMSSQPLVRAANSPVTIGGPFTLTSPDGTVTEQAYLGKWLLVYFGFTSCPDTCPTALLEIAAALGKLGPDADKLQPLFITVDPLRDTPAVMGNYTQSFDPRIVGLTGTPQQIAAVAQEYGVYYAPRKSGPGAEDYVMDHGTYLYLMDPEGRFVRGFDADTPSDRIAEAVRSAMAKTREKCKSSGTVDAMRVRPDQLMLRGRLIPSQRGGLS